MKTVCDVRLNPYAGLIVHRSPIVNEYGDRYGWYFSNQPHEGSSQVVIGWNDHDPECGCNRCCGFPDIYDQVVIAGDMHPTRSFAW